MKRLLSPTVFCLLVLPVLVASAVAVLMAMPSAPEAAQYAAVLPLAYLFGSIPWGYFFLYWRRGLDIREYGSGRIGVSNVLRTGGGGVAALVLLLDLSKSVVMVLLARELIGTTTAEVTVGLMALLGHNWPVFLKFRGGRGIVTGLGGLSVMAPLAAAIAAVAFIPTQRARYNAGRGHHEPVALLTLRLQLLANLAQLGRCYIELDVAFCRLLAEIMNDGG